MALTCRNSGISATIWRVQAASVEVGSRERRDMHTVLVGSCTYLGNSFSVRATPWVRIKRSCLGQPDHLDALRTLSCLLS